jgi:threonine dehydrogenase-like Zn-dependent dehydrogenase
MSPMEELTSWSASHATRFAFTDPEFHKREASLLGSRNATPEDFAEVFDAMRRGAIRRDVLVTHRVSLDEAPGSFPIWVKPEARDQGSHRDLGS